jgi:hypothetical protein
VLVLLLIVTGGLVEGLALGALQAGALARLLHSFSRSRWVISTTLVAGLGWAAASAPSQLADSTGTSPVPAVWVVVGGMALGGLMGVVLGAAQAGGLRASVNHPWRWIPVSALAWAPAMGIIFAGATAPDPTWRAGTTLVLAALTGATAGATMGLVSGLCWPLVQAQPRQ